MAHFKLDEYMPDISSYISKVVLPYHRSVFEALHSVPVQETKAFVQVMEQEELLLLSRNN